jgi:hypothetical protein
VIVLLFSGLGELGRGAKRRGQSNWSRLNERAERATNDEKRLSSDGARDLGSGTKVPNP